MATQPAFTLRGISIVMLGVQDMNRAIAFYRDKLGLGLKFQTPGDNFAFLDAGPVTLALSQPLARNRQPTAGATELVFPVEGVREAYDALQSQGIQFTQGPRNVNGPDWAANFQDPDGHALSIFGPERKQW